MQKHDKNPVEDSRIPRRDYAEQGLTPSCRSRPGTRRSASWRRFRSFRRRRPPDSARGRRAHRGNIPRFSGDADVLAARPFPLRHALHACSSDNRPRPPVSRSCPAQCDRLGAGKGLSASGALASAPAQSFFAAACAGGRFGRANSPACAPRCHACYSALASLARFCSRHLLLRAAALPDQSYSSSEQR